MTLRPARFATAVAIVALAMLPARARALSPEQLFEVAGASIVRIAVLDDHGVAIRQGSGVVVRSGDVVANCNAVAGNAQALVVFRGAKWALAQLVGTDQKRNLCHLKWRGDEAIGVPVKGIVAIEDVRKGQVAYAVGSPRGLELALSGSFVSGFRRHPERGMVIETETPVAAEASGGGVFDRDGRLIGFTAVVLTEGQKLDFAVPASAAFELVPGLRTRRSVPGAPAAKDEGADRGHHARLQAEAARLAEARRFLEAQRQQDERDRARAEEERVQTPEALGQAPAPPGPERPGAAPVPVRDAAAPVSPTSPVHRPAALQAIGERIQQALDGAPLGAKVYCLDLTVALDPAGRVARLTLDRSSGERGADNAVAARIVKSGPYRETADGGPDGLMTLALRVGWFHDHAAVIAMFGALPPYAAPPGRPVTEAAASAPGDTGLQPDGDAGNEARELAARQLRAAEEQRALQRKAEAERLVQAKEDEQRANRETAETEGRLAVTAGAYAQRVVEDYTHRVSSAIGEKFAIPPSAPTEARAEIEFRVLPDGQVAAVRFVQKSGLTAFDRAIEQAIERARPLPVPPDPGIYLQFRDQRLVFTGAR